MMDICRENFDEAHPWFGLSARQFGTICIEDQRFEEAITWSKMAIQNATDLFGRDSVQVAHSEIILAKAFEATSQVELAIKCRINALAIFERDTHMHSWEARMTLIDLAKNCVALKSYDDAVSYYERAEGFLQDSSQECTSETANVLEGLASVYALKERHADAIAYYSNANELRDQDSIEYAINSEHLSLSLIHI